MRANKPSLERLVQRLTDNEDIITLIERAIVEEPPLSTTEREAFIRLGFSSELDQIRNASHNGRKWIADMEQRERKRTGINNLKVGYNKATGYFIEVSSSNIQSRSSRLCAPTNTLELRTLYHL